MRFKDLHYPEIIKNLHFVKLYNGNNAEVCKMGDFNELFILDSLSKMQDYQLIPKSVNMAEYEFINNKIIFNQFQFFFTKENDFIMANTKKNEYFVLKVK